MSMNIHPLQEASVNLLSTLNKPFTRAMITIGNGYYPSLESILSTLEYYKDEKAVIEFVEANIVVIESAKAELQSSNAQPETLETKTQQATEGIFSKPSLGLANAYASLKSVSFSSIEELLSKELSQLCNEELIVEITSAKRGQESYHTSAELGIRVKPKHMFANKPPKAGN